MNAGFVCERVAADDRLVRLHPEADKGRQHLACRIKQGRINVVHERKPVRPNVYRHNNFLESSVTRAFAYDVDGALNLPGARLQSGESISDAKAKVIMTVHADRYVTIADNSFLDRRCQSRILVRQHISYRVRYIQHAGSRFD